MFLPIVENSIGDTQTITDFTFISSGNEVLDVYPYVDGYVIGRIDIAASNDYRQRANSQIMFAGAADVYYYTPSGNEEVYQVAAYDNGNGTPICEVAIYDVTSGENGADYVDSYTINGLNDLTGGWANRELIGAEKIQLTAGNTYAIAWKINTVTSWNGKYSNTGTNE